MRVCRTARRGIFRFKLRYCDREILRRWLIKALAAQDFYEDGCDAELLCGADLIQRRAGSWLCSTEFAPLRNDKIYGAFSLAAGSALRRVCFAGKVLRRLIKFKMRA